jgi:hypothetical protein
LGNQVGNEQRILAVTRPAAVVEQLLGVVDVQTADLDHLVALLGKPAGKVDPVDTGRFQTDDDGRGRSRLPSLDLGRQGLKSFPAVGELKRPANRAAGHQSAGNVVELSDIDPDDEGVGLDCRASLH